MPVVSRRYATTLEVSCHIEIIKADKPEHEIQRSGQLQALMVLIRDRVDTESECRHA